MYDLTQFSGDGYYAVGGGASTLETLQKYVKENVNYFLALVVVLVLLVIALYLGYLKPYKKEGLISGAMASLGVGGARRSDYGTPDEMVIKLNYGSSEGFDDASKAAREARDLSVMSANDAAAVIAGQPCSNQILASDDSYAWMNKVAHENYAQPNDAQLTASMKGY